MKGVQNLFLNQWPKLSNLAIGAIILILGENQLEDEGLRLLLSKINRLKCLNICKMYSNVADNNCTGIGLSSSVAYVIHNANLT